MKPFLLSIMLVVTCAVQAQLTVTTNYRQDGSWNTKASKWDVYYTDEDQTVFNFNKELTTFRHITKTITSKYTILEWDYNEETILYTMKVKSDAGNQYEMMIDGINNCVVFFYYDKDNNYIMVRHTIKDSHYDE